MTERTDNDKVFEISKHMTTLSAGSTVLIGTFMKDIFPKTTTGDLNLSLLAKLILLSAFIAFFLSTVAAVLAMVPSNGYFAGSMKVSVVLFVAGIITFGVIAYLSLNIPSEFKEEPEAIELPTPSPLPGD